MMFNVGSKGVHLEVVLNECNPCALLELQQWEGDGGRGDLGLVMTTIPTIAGGGSLCYNLVRGITSLEQLVWRMMWSTRRRLRILRCGIVTWVLWWRVCCWWMLLHACCMIAYHRRVCSRTEAHVDRMTGILMHWKWGSYMHVISCTRVACNRVVPSIVQCMWDKWAGAQKALTCLCLIRRTRGINEAQSNGTRSLYSCSAVVCDGAVQPNGSRNLQIVTSDLAHWLWQSGMV